jgi:uncharacterized protein involved in exopolysaccharide biosynthesis
MSSSFHLTLAGLVAWVTAKGKPRHHVRRYILGAILSVAGCVTMAGAYMTVLPPAYTSKWTLIVPGAGADTRVSLDRLGQAQSTSNSPFSDKVLSPKVNYKEIAASEPVIAEAARLADTEPADMPKPGMKLIDQSSIMELQISAATPDEAQRRAWAHFQALRTRLDHLRDDEIKTRNQALRSNISEVEVGLKVARQRLLDLQTQTGLASPEQYNQLVSALETMRKEHGATKAALAEKTRQVDTLRVTLGLLPEQAALIVRASANPELRRLALAHATTNALYSETLKRFGTGHPRVVDLRNKLSSLADALAAVRPAGSEQIPREIMDIALASENERFIGMLTDLVARNAELQGQLARIAELEQGISDLETRRLQLASVAARLDDLQRDHLIANTVFSSALARLDAGKADQYASYPVLQMMSEPTLPERPSSPRFVFALLGAVGGSLLSCLGWLFAWLHQWFLFHRLERRFLPASLIPAT